MTRGGSRGDRPVQPPRANRGSGQSTPGRRDRGIAGPLRRLALGDEEAERQIIERYLGGLSLRQAGVPFGAGPGTVTAVLDRHGIARRRAGRSRQAVPTAALAAASGDDRWLRAGEVTAALGVSKRTTYRLIGSGELEAVRVGSRGLRVRESALRAYLCSRQAPLPGAIAAVFGDDDGAPYLQAGPIGETRVNGQVVTRHVLAPGDVISFGKVSCTVGSLAAPDPRRLPASANGEEGQRAGLVKEEPVVR